MANCACGPFQPLPQELADTNVSDHNTHDYLKANNMRFQVVADTDVDQQ